MARRKLPTIQIRDENTGYIELSRASDTIRRKKLLHVLPSFPDVGIVLIIRFLPWKTTVVLTTGTRCRRYSSSCRPTSKQPFGRCADAFQADLAPADNNLLREADSANFISTDHDYPLNKVNETAPITLGDWFLYVNVDKLEQMIVSRESDRVVEERTTTKKVGSLLGNIADLSRQKNAVTAFHVKWSL